MKLDRLDLPVEAEVDRWKRTDTWSRFRLNFATRPPVGLCRISGTVTQLRRCRMRPRLVVCADHTHAIEDSFELVLSSDLRFHATLYVPLWCRELYIATLRPDPDFDCRFDHFEALGFRRSLWFVGAARLMSLRARWSQLRSWLRPSIADRNGTGPPDDRETYRRFLERAEPDLDVVEDAVLEHQASFGRTPKFSVVMPLASDAAPARIRRAVMSLFNQTYPNWELLIASPALCAKVQQLDPRFAGDCRFRVIETLPDKDGAVSFSRAIEKAEGEYLCLMSCEDVLSPLAIYAAAAENEREAFDVLYADEDAIDDSDARSAPVFRSGWNWELLHSHAYISGLVFFRRDAIANCGGWRESAGDAAHYDLLLRIARSAPASGIRHVPMMLLHRGAARPDDPEKWEAERHILRVSVGEEAVVEPGLMSGAHRVRWSLPSPPPRVSIIVPTRDGGDHFRTCVETLFTLSSYPDFELLVVDNQSVDPATLAYFDKCARRPQVRMLRFDAPFNYSAINNFAAEQATGAVLVLLNDDTEVLSAGWLEELVSHAVRSDVGAVGAKLYYPDGTIQHAGVGLGIGAVAGHLHLGAPHEANGYLGRLKMVQAVGAVTGACLAVEKKKFDAVCGLDEANLHVALNDIDLCIKLAERGWRCVWTPYAELVHHESKSRGKDTTAEKQALFRHEHAYMRQRWPRELSGDPYYHRHLSRTELDLSFCTNPRPYRPWRNDKSASDRDIGETR